MDDGVSGLKSERHMIVGIPKERSPYEYRVGLPPAGVSLFLQHGHRVYVEKGAGVGAGFRDQDYGREGAQIAYSAEELFGRADLALKFARPLREELESMREGAALAGFLHLAAAREDKLQLIAEKQLTALAYELVQEDSGERPIMAPLSQIGGRMAVQIAARLLQNDHGGRGILLGGLAGGPPAEVAVLGAGVAVPGKRAPVLVGREVVAHMKPRALILDLSIDQGGCIENSRPTDHGSPTFLEEGVLHYCVPNISGVLGRTATHALFMAAYPYLEQIANLGLAGALQASPALARAATRYSPP